MASSSRTAKVVEAPVTKPAVRCAIYTRKSTDENLESSFKFSSVLLRV